MRRAVKKYLNYLKRIKNIEKLFKENYSLAEINKAIQDLKKNRVLRPIIKNYDHINYIFIF